MTTWQSPFGMMELMARIRAALRHGGQREPQSRTYSLGTLFVDPARHIVPGRGAGGYPDAEGSFRSCVC